MASPRTATRPAPPAAPPAGDAPAPASRGLTRRPWWPWLKRLVTVGFLGVVAYLVVQQAREVEWGQVAASMRRQPLTGLLIAALLTAASHALFSTFDLLGRRLTGHRLPATQVWTVNFVSYAFNLNLGSLIGGFGFRYRLYSRLGLDNATITQVIAISMLSNWLGYLLVGGLAFASGQIEPPGNWKIGAGQLQLLGAVLVAVAVGYVLFCALAKRRVWEPRGHRITLPDLRLALVQLAIASTNWLLMGGIVYVLLQQKVGYFLVLSVLLIAAIAGVVTQVPAGLGVLEAVFVALLPGDVLPRSELIGALLAYRAVYYLAPLAVAVVVYGVMEARAKRLAGAAPAQAAPARQPQADIKAGNATRRRR